MKTTTALLLTLATAARAGTLLPQVLGDVPPGIAPAAPRDTVCTPGDDAACDDGNVCTDDRCDPVRGCVSEPIAGTCWLLRGRTTFIATALGHTCACTQSTGTTALALRDDGRYGVDGGTCPGTQQPLTDEEGTSAARGRRLVLDIENFPDVLRSAQDCAGGGATVTVYRTSVRRSADGTRLRGTHTTRGRAVGSPVSVTAVTHFTGVPGDGTVPGLTPPLRCGARLASCLRDAVR